MKFAVRLFPFVFAAMLAAATAAANTPKALVIMLDGQRGENKYGPSPKYQ